MNRPSCWRLFMIATSAIATQVSIGKTHAETAFDDTWTMTVMTERGDCDPAIHLGVFILNGALQYAGDSPVVIKGKVANNGLVHATMAGGNRTASANGELSPRGGSGTWHGAGSAGACNGRWSAERR